MKKFTDSNCVLIAVGEIAYSRKIFELCFVTDKKTRVLLEISIIMCVRPEFGSGLLVFPQ